MDDFISREAAIALTDQHCFETSYDAVWMEEELRKLPAADVRPVVRARWKAHGDCGVTECPVCRWSIEECVDYNYCPNCGADMRTDKTAREEKNHA